MPSSRGKPHPAAFGLHVSDEEVMMLERVTSRPPASCLSLLGLVLVVAVGTGCTEEKAPDYVPLTVRAQPVAAVDYATEYKLTGELTARTEVSLSFRLAGKVTERAADVGTKVEPGVVLARLDPTQQRANVEAAVAAVAAAEATLKQSASNLERQTSLLAQGFSTRRDYDLAMQAQQSSQAAVDGARAQLALARDQLDQTELRSPSRGVLTSRDFEVGQIVGAAQPLFTLAEDGPRDVVVDVQEGLIGHILKTGLKISLVSDPNVRAVGNIREISPVTNAITGTVRVKVGLDAVPAEMRIGSAVSVMLRSEPQPVLSMPPSALYSDNGKPSVWVVDPAAKTVSLKPIEVAAFETAAVYIASGVKAGDLVVTAGGNMLHADQQVSITEGAKP